MIAAQTHIIRTLVLPTILVAMLLALLFSACTDVPIDSNTANGRDTTKQDTVILPPDGRDTCIDCIPATRRPPVIRAILLVPHYRDTLISGALRYVLDTNRVDVSKGLSVIVREKGGRPDEMSVLLQLNKRMMPRPLIVQAVDSLLDILAIDLHIAEINLANPNVPYSAIELFRDPGSGNGMSIKYQPLETNAVIYDWTGNKVRGSLYQGDPVQEHTNFGKLDLDVSDRFVRGLVSVNFYMRLAPDNSYQAKLQVLPIRLELLLQYR